MKYYLLNNWLQIFTGKIKQIFSAHPHHYLCQKSYYSFINDLPFHNNDCTLEGPNKEAKTEYNKFFRCIGCPTGICPGTSCIFVVYVADFPYSTSWSKQPSFNTLDKTICREILSGS